MIIDIFLLPLYFPALNNYRRVAHEQLISKFAAQVSIIEFRSLSRQVQHAPRKGMSTLSDPEIFGVRK
jgi:hypothetical protein